MNSKSVQTFLLVVVTATLHAQVRCTSPLVSPRLNATLNVSEYVQQDRSLSSKLSLYLFGLSETNRIVGGSYASESQFPFMVVVHRLLDRGQVSQCGGTILSARWVLTAGHCIANGPRRFFVIFGVVNKAGIGYDYNHGSGVSMTTTQSIVHPEYRVTMNDIGLLYMPHDIPFSRNILPVQLPSSRYIGHSFVNRRATVIGWGRDQHTPLGTKGLKYANLPIISNFQCGNYWAVSAKHICTAPGYGEDACQGDSGGPLIVTENGRYIQIGIVSYGDHECPSSKPGVFVRVTSYLDWISRITGI